MNYPYSYPTTPKREYRFPAIRWSNQHQGWLIYRSDIAARGVVIEHQEIDPTQLPQPVYFPGQMVVFRDASGKRHQGTVESVGTYGCAYHDPREHDYWYRWTYLGSMSYTYHVRSTISVAGTITTSGCYEVFAEAIHCLVATPHG